MPVIKIGMEPEHSGKFCETKHLWAEHIQEQNIQEASLEKESTS